MREGLERDLDRAPDASGETQPRSAVGEVGERRVDEEFAQARTDLLEEGEEFRLGRFDRFRGWRGAGEGVVEVELEGEGGDAGGAAGEEATEVGGREGDVGEPEAAELGRAGGEGGDGDGVDVSGDVEGTEVREGRDEELDVGESARNSVDEGAERGEGGDDG